jgi:L-lactate utilization protein LutB
LLPSFGNILTYITFKINQNEIAKTICVQRKLAHNTCNGRCELQKSLKKLNDNEKKMQNNLKEKTELVCLQHLLNLDYTVVMPNVLAKSNFSDCTQKTISFSKSNFRPPAFFV